MLSKSLKRHETKFILFLAWIVVPSVFTLLGFYLGTIFGNREHVQDLQTTDIHSGLVFAEIFFVISIVAAIVVTAVFPKVVEKDYADREAKWDSHSESHH